MTGRPSLSLADLDALIGSLDFPVRSETLERAWDLTIQKAQIMILVTMRAKPGRERELEQAAREFVAATSHLEGALGSTL